MGEGIGGRTSHVTSIGRRVSVRIAMKKHRVAPAVMTGPVEWSYRVEVRPYQTRPMADRFTVGDVIRCPSFRWGMRLLRQNPAGIVAVALRDKQDCMMGYRPDEAVAMHDESRGSARFLVIEITLNEAVGPGD